MMGRIDWLSRKSSPFWPVNGGGIFGVLKIQMWYNIGRSGNKRKGVMQYDLGRFLNTYPRRCRWHWPMDILPPNTKILND